MLRSAIPVLRLPVRPAKRVVTRPLGMPGNRHALRSTAAALHHHRTLPTPQARIHGRRSCLQPPRTSAPNALNQAAKRVRTSPSPSNPGDREAIRSSTQMPRNPLTGKLARDPQLPPHALYRGATDAISTQRSGPIVAQTPPEQSQQSPDTTRRLPPEPGAIAGDSRRSSPTVVFVGAACHAGGRGFESRRSRFTNALQTG